MLIFLIVGLMDPLWQLICHKFVIAFKKIMCIYQGFPRSVDAAQILVDPLGILIFG
jgi:hypothetical protein